MNIQVLRFRCPKIPKRRLLTFALIAIVIVLLHVVIRLEQIWQPGEFYDLDFPTEYIPAPRASLQLEEFPQSGKNIIPKIIHQTWKNSWIPDSVIPWINSWLRNHPDWQYWFWTDESARELIADKYPEYLSMFDLYTEGIRKADALRYFVLYEYGGVYADLDLESLRPLDPMTLKYSCFLGQEPYEHPMMDSNSDHLAINAIMGCRRRHSFMKFIIENLPNFAHMWNVLDSTGPHFLTLLYNSYVKAQQNTEPTQGDAVYLAPPDYFMPTLCPLKFSYFRLWCEKFNTLSHIQQKACVSLKVNGLHRKPLSFSFTDHHWTHWYGGFNVMPWKGKTKITKIVPKVKMYMYHTIGTDQSVR